MAGFEVDPTNRLFRHQHEARRERVLHCCAPAVLPSLLARRSTICRCLPKQRRLTLRRGESIRRRAPKFSGLNLARTQSGQRWSRVETTRNYCSVQEKDSRNHGHGYLRRRGLPFGESLLRITGHHLVRSESPTRLILSEWSFDVFSEWRPSM